MGEAPSIGVYDKEGITYMKNIKVATEHNSPADIIGSGPSFVQLSAQGMPGMGIKGPAAGKTAEKETVEEEKSADNSTANATANATADSNSTSEANATANASGNATTLKNKTKPEYNAPADVMPYAAANDLPEEKPIDWKMERKDKVTPYLARPAKYRVNYPEENHHHKYAPPAPKKDD